MNKLFPILLLAMIALVPACIDFDTKGNEELLGKAPATWPYRPVAMRFHPFTAIDRDQDSSVFYLDAHVELVDRNGDTTKGVGNILFELYEKPAAASSDEITQTRLYFWSYDMIDDASNRLTYDSIQKLYKFRLRLDGNLNPDEQYIVKATFVDDAEQKMKADTTITGKKSEE